MLLVVKTCEEGVGKDDLGSDTFEGACANSCASEVGIMSVQGSFDSKYLSVFLLLIGGPLVASNTLNATVSSAFHHQLFVNTFCIQSGCCGGLERVVGLVARNVSFLARILHEVLKGVMS